MIVIMQNKLDVKIKYISDKIGDTIKEPFYASKGAGGMDLSACINMPLVLNPGQKINIPTGIAIQLPDNQYLALIYARSGLAIKHGITLANGVGVIDSDYTGEIICGLINLSDKPYTINPGDRVAQMIFTPIVLAKLTLVDELSPTERGIGGLGSTGK